MPYIWSLNNVVLAENGHTALADWEAGRPEQAFSIFKGNILDSMYRGLCPGNLHMSSMFDAYRQESQRDFADPIGVMARAFVEGLFGVRPDLLKGEVVVAPGFPEKWDRARMAHPDFETVYVRAAPDNGTVTERYTFVSRFAKEPSLHLVAPVHGEKVVTVKVNGKEAPWKVAEESVGQPRIEVLAAPAKKWEVEVTSAGAPVEGLEIPPVVAAGEKVPISTGAARVLKVNDPQGVLAATMTADGTFEIGKELGSHTFFVQLAQGNLTWWAPMNVEVRPAIEILAARSQTAEGLQFVLRNNTGKAIDENVKVMGKTIHVKAEARGGETQQLMASGTELLPGTNVLELTRANEENVSGRVVNWKLRMPETANVDAVDCTKAFNASVAGIFKTAYLAPRSPYCSLSIPKQGVGGWAAFNVLPVIDDAGVRGKAVTIAPRLAIDTVADEKNAVFASYWENYPREVTIPLNGVGKHLYLLMAGTTNPMRSRMRNGEVEVTYMDGTKSLVTLENPANWWPIEQDCLTDDFAFSPGVTSLPPRVDLATGTMRTLEGIRKKTRLPAAGGSGQVIDVPLAGPGRELKSVTVRAMTYEVIVGVMGMTVVR
jgi:hypothetical protein